ncbi:MAG TPA: hypothetical protein VKY65_12900, partial [Alphaproteobacteria bacterium]|nr:hypothetical protein [Alphaproteobacteria bacterium]
CRRRTMCGSRRTATCISSCNSPIRPKAAITDGAGPPGAVFLSTNAAPVVSFLLISPPDDESVRATGKTVASQA